MTTASHPPVSVGPAWQRIWGMVLRHFYLLRSSWPRMLELMYWPTFQLLLWGFITQFLLTHSSWVAQAAGVLISAVLLWDVLFRSNLGLSLSFIEEMWARNLGQLFISPLKPYEMVAGLMVMSLLRTLISITPAAFLAFPFFDVWVFELGLPLITFFVNLLIMGWAVGLLVAGLILRFGLGAESLCWLGIFLVAPISGIYYPGLGVARLGGADCLGLTLVLRLRRHAGRPFRQRISLGSVQPGCRLERSLSHSIFQFLSLHVPRCAAARLVVATR